MTQTFSPPWAEFPEDQLPLSLSFHFVFHLAVLDSPRRWGLRCWCHTEFKVGYREQGFWFLIYVGYGYVRDSDISVKVFSSSIISWKCSMTEIFVQINVPVLSVIHGCEIQFKVAERDHELVRSGHQADDCKYPFMNGRPLNSPIYTVDRHDRLREHGCKHGAPICWARLSDVPQWSFHRFNG